MIKIMMIKINILMSNDEEDLSAEPVQLQRTPFCHNQKNKRFDNQLHCTQA